MKKITPKIIPIGYKITVATQQSEICPCPHHVGVYMTGEVGVHMCWNKHFIYLSGSVTCKKTNTILFLNYYVKINCMGKLSNSKHGFHLYKCGYSEHAFNIHEWEKEYIEDFNIKDRLINYMMTVQKSAQLLFNRFCLRINLYIHLQYLKTDVI